MIVIERVLQMSGLQPQEQLLKSLTLQREAEIFLLVFFVISGVVMRLLNIL